MADAPSAGVYSQHTNPVQFQNAPVGSFRHIQFTLPPAVVSALSAATIADLQFTLIFGMAPNTQPFLVDKLNFGQASQSDGGTDAGSVTGSGASTGTGNSAGGATGTGGAGGGAGAGGGGAAGNAGASAGGGNAAGTGGTAGGGTTTGTFGPCAFSAPSASGQAEEVDFTIRLPHGVRREDVGLATLGGVLRLDDGVRLVKDTGGFSSISSVSAIGRTELGVSAEVQDVYSEKLGVDLRSNAHVHGTVKTADTLTLQTGALVDGETHQSFSLEPIDDIAWVAAFPLTNRGSCSLEPDNSEVIDPGSYGDVAIKSRSHLRIRSGTYYFNSLSFEPQSVLDIDNTAGPVFIYVLGNFAFGGAVVESDATHMNFLFGVAGANDIAIQSPFRGILVAPNATVNLPTEGTLGHVGSFFTRSLIAHQSTVIHQRPLLPAEFCIAGAACSTFCPCDSGAGTCIVDSACRTGLVCGPNNGRRFDRPGGTSVCWDPQCGTESASLACGSPAQACGRCSDVPRSCASDGDCISGEVCGSANGARFGIRGGGNVCWPTICETAPNSAGQCGSPSAACGKCDCSANCTTKHCGDDPSDGCGGYCAGLCSVGQAGCISDLDCASGNVCGIGVGERFGLPAGSNVCWAAACKVQDPSKPNCGVGSAQCGACPACVPHCGADSSGPDGCGGFCGECAGIRVNGQCINAAAVDPPAYPVPLSSSPTSEVGTLSGSFRVTDRGTASYSVPIAVPPGRMGMEPNLSLNYASTKANGMLGMGWSLGGLSTIARCPSIIDREGATNPVKFDATDHFCLDGQALVQVTPSTQPYGADGAEYRTEVDSFRKIVSHTGTGSESGAGPQSFEVRTKDGRILTYGGTSDSIIAAPVQEKMQRIWGLSGVVDRSGNAMRITYAPSNVIFATTVPEGRFA